MMGPERPPVNGPPGAGSAVNGYRDRCQVDERGTVLAVLLEFLDDSQGQSRLADPTRSGQRDEANPVPANQRRDRGDLALPPDE